MRGQFDFPRDAGVPRPFPWTRAVGHALPGGSAELRPRGRSGLGRHGRQGQ